MIPKIIHYCWFGGNPLPDLALKCIESWKKYLPDYEIIRWDETNFDINICDYVKEAYDAKKWAFVTDYVRLFAMYNYGGIYMDTDVEVVKNLDSFLLHEAFSGFESNKDIPTGIMACKKEFPLFKVFLDNYSDRHFVLKDGKYDLTTNVETITAICKNYNFAQNNMLQNIEGFVLYPNDYFCPKDWKTGLIERTDNTYTIHHFSGSWLNDEAKKAKKKKEKVISKFGYNLGPKIYYIISAPRYVFKTIHEEGVSVIIKRIFDIIIKKEK